MKTCNLELAKQLKDAGYPQLSCDFYWVITLTTNYHLSWYEGNLPDVLKERNDCYASPTADEILDLLPNTSYVRRNKKGYSASYYYQQANIFREDTASDALARLYIYLKKQKFI